MKKFKEIAIFNLVLLLLVTSYILFTELLKLEKIVSEQNFHPHRSAEHLHDLSTFYLADIPRDHAYIRGIDLQKEHSTKDFKIAKELSNYIPSGRNYIIMISHYEENDKTMAKSLKIKVENLFSKESNQRILEELNEIKSKVK